MTVATDPSGCRVDVWLWRARFFKTRALGARFVEEGRVRRLRDGVESRLDKASRTVRPGDGLVFALAGRLVAVEIAAAGERRGPAIEAHAPLPRSPAGPASGSLNATGLRQRVDSSPPLP